MRATALTLALFLTTCASVAPQVEESVVSDRIFCGLSIPGGGEVTQADIDTFIHEVVTPRFPDGFTVWRAQGQWKGGNEQTLVIEILHPYDIRFDRAVEEIADEYRTRFRQGRGDAGDDAGATRLRRLASTLAFDCRGTLHACLLSRADLHAMNVTMDRGLILELWARRSCSVELNVHADEDATAAVTAPRMGSSR